MAFAAILAVVLATLTIAYTINADAVTAQNRELQAALQASEASRAKQSSEVEARSANADTAYALLQQRFDALRSQVVELERQAAEARAAQSRAERDLAAARSEAQIAAGTVKTQSDLISSVSGDNQTLLDSERRARREVIELTDRRNELESQVASLRETNRLQSEQLALLQRELAETQGERRGEAGRFAASVQDVRVDPGSQDTLVSLNIGREERIRPATRLYVIRDNQWIANLDVVDVDVNTSVARVATLASGQTVRRGDRVTSTLGN
ncbi:MAG: hypothetical protein EA423_07530 [Phycisphaerales bacterium]|nr:MAG: hypothetical protein EA423_07530 [Phycisphaerales bacterium]